MKIAIIGTGPAGMTTAYVLAKNNIPVDVYEASYNIGGLCRSMELWNQTVDLGPHRFFSSDKRVNELWLDVVGNEYEMVNRLTRIYYKNKFFYYPLKIGNVISNLGLLESAASVLSYIYQKLLGSHGDQSFEHWVKGRFGNRLFKIFFQTYTEKLWGIKCVDLDADFAAQRIKKLTMYEAIKNAIFAGRKNIHKTLVDQFAYPVGGTGTVYKKMAALVEKKGNTIVLDSPVYRIITQNNRVTGIELIDGSFKKYDHVVTSMPFTTMVSRLPEVPDKVKQNADQLTYRNTVLVYILLNSTKVFSDNWLYVHSSDLLMGRITNFRNWIPSLYGNEQKSILALEYWCYEEDEMWSFEDKKFIELASSELVNTGLVKEDIIEDGYVVHINKSYPVYSRGYKKILAPIEEYVASIKGLQAVGRYGSFKYNNQDHSILMGLMAAENIMGKACNNLSEVNSDYETYQESYIVTKTGLAKQDL